ncbi:MAG: protein translocase subunit SecD [Gammaproteobacteria bacterium]|nr:protein translocase subunit SecD [Gammaproteobacteria bacterium]
MLNQYPLWKYVLILAIVVPGFFYAFPNLYGEDPGIHVVGVRATHVDTAVLQRIESTLSDAGISIKSAMMDEKGAKLRFADTEQQLKARDVVQQALGNQFTVALSLLPSTPEWMEKLGAVPMFLGLDLRGGVHFLMEVDLESAVRRAEERYVDDLRGLLREEGIRHQGVRRLSTGGMEIKLRSHEDRERARDVIERQVPELVVAEIEREGDPYLRAGIGEQALEELGQFALEQNMTALRNRINELGVAEPVVQRQGNQRIVVQLPGVQDTAKAKEILGRTATLEMMLVDEEHDLQAALAGSVPAGSKVYPHRNGSSVLLKNRVIYSGDNIIDAAAGLDSQTGGPVVHITLDARGAAINQRITGENIGNRMAVVYIELKSDTKRDAEGRPQLDADGNEIKIKQRIEEVITAPVIRDQLGKRFQIEGLDGIDEARDLALLLRAGALAAPVEIIEERTVGPSLGQDNIDQGFRSVMIGFLLVLVFMTIYYRLFGWVANLALALNLVLIVAVLSLFQATLTLPGVAGIVLTVGMAVDANVLIFERIREELRNGNSPQASIHVGYDRALTTIVDANVTTLIAAIVLFNFGTGPIKGFAITLSIGIVTSMFTAIFGTRGVINLIYGGRRVEKLSI